MQRLLVTVLSTGLALSMGCETGDARGHDADLPDARVPLPPEPAVAAPAPPDIPWLADGAPPIAPPVLRSDCPPGWAIREVHTSVAVCHPYPDGFVADCGPTGAHFPGEPACRELDRDASEWPPELPSEGTLFVRPGALEGDGSRGSPFATIADALAVATEGSTIALAPGTHDLVDAALDVANVHVVGTSVSRTTLRGLFTEDPGSSASRAMLHARAAGLELSDVSIDVHRRALIVESGAEVTLRRVVTGGGGAAIRVEDGGALSLVDVVSREPTASLVEAWGASSVQVDHLAIAGARITSGRVGGVIELLDGARLVASDVVVDGGGSLSPVYAHEGAEAVLSRVALIGAQALFAALGRLDAEWLFAERPPREVVACSSGEIALRDVAIVGDPSPPSALYVHAILGCTGSLARGVGVGVPLANAYGPFVATDVISRDAPGPGITVFGGAFTGERIDVRGASILGVSVVGGGEVSLLDVTVRHVRSVGLVYGRGVGIETEDATVRRLDVEGCVAGLMTERGRLELEDARFASLTLGQRDAPNAAVVVFGDGELTTRRLLVEDFPGTAVSVSGERAATLEDVVIRGGRRAESIGIAGGPFADTLVARRVDVGDGSGTGVVVRSHTTLEDLFLHDLRAPETWAHGVLVQPMGGSSSWTPLVRLARVRLVDVEGFAIRARVPIGTSPARWPLEVEDLYVARITRGGCRACLAAGIDVAGDLTATLSRFVLREIAGTALVSSERATITASEGLVGNATACGALSEPSPSVVFASCD